MTTTMTARRIGLLTERAAGEWVAEVGSRPRQRMLFGEFWREGEMAVLFGEAGAGKSVLAVQIADAIARGAEFGPLRDRQPPREVLYFDLELSARQFAMRYAREGEDGRLSTGHRFSSRLRRIEVDLTAEIPEGCESLDEYLAEAIEAKIRESGAKILIFDNINRLKQTCESVRETLPMMRALRRMQRRYDLSILVVAQTTRRVTHRGLKLADLAGAKVLANYADSVFAIGESRSYSSARYLKQIGPRSSERIFGSENVPTFGLEKIGGRFLGFEFWWFATEHEHLRGQDTAEDHTLARVRAMAEHGHSVREIARHFKRSKSAVHRYLKMLKADEANAELGTRNAECEDPKCVTAKADAKSSPPYARSEVAEGRGGSLAPGHQVTFAEPDRAENHPVTEAVTPLLRKEGSCEVADFEAWREQYWVSLAEGRRPESYVRAAAGDRQPAGDDPPSTHADKAASAGETSSTPDFHTDAPLERDLDGYDREIWVESRDHFDRPAVWYQVLNGRKYKKVRRLVSIEIKEIKDEPAGTKCGTRSAECGMQVAGLHRDGLSR